MCNKSFQFYVLDPRVVFGTTLDRELLPLKTPHTRAGNEMGLRGVPNLGPGSYDNAEVCISHRPPFFRANILKEMKIPILTAFVDRNETVKPLFHCQIN